MPFNNSVVGGTVLVRNAVQSQNYMPGTSGWHIGRDGSAEFNAGTFRGSIEVGPLAGQHFYVNNTSTGDVIDVYNSSGNLTFWIDGNGVLHSTNPQVANGQVVTVTGGLISFDNVVPAQKFGTGPNVLFSGGSASAGALKVDGGIPVGALSQPSLVLNANVTTSAQDIQATQRGITGDVVQLDTTTSTNQLAHLMATAVYNTDAAGDFTVTHGAAFTPNIIFSAQTGALGNSGAVSIFTDPATYTPTQFKGRVYLGSSPLTNNSFGSAFLMFG